MFTMGIVVASAILLGGLVDLLGGKNRILEGIMVTVMLALGLFVLIAPVYAAQPDSSIHSISVKLGPENFSLFMTPSGELKVVAEGNTISVKLDTTIFPPESLGAILDSISEIIDSQMALFGVNDTLQPDSLAAVISGMFKNISGSKGIHISGKPIVKVFSVNTGADEKESSEKSEKSGGIGAFLGSMFDSFTDVLGLFIIFITGLLMILGVPIILGLLLYYRWRWAHQERMKALEMGATLPADTKNGTSILRTGMAIWGLGGGILVGVLLHQGFWFLLGAALLGWGFGLVAGYYVSRYEIKGGTSNYKVQPHGGEKTPQD